MDFRRPVEAVVPGVRGRLLAVLAETSAALNLRTTARLAGVSPAQASRVLPDLVAQGMVERTEVPPSALFSLVEEHVASRLVRALTRSRETALAQMGMLAGRMDPPPVSVVVYGSFARGEADEASDLDVVVIRPEGVVEDGDGWATSVDDWRSAVRRLTGNSVEVLEIGEAEVPRRLRQPTALWRDLLRDGIPVHGPSLDALAGAPRG
jgi:hypothetical protein